MKRRCPPILLIDEGFAALDPKSRTVVQSKLKAFCAHSLILVIYHSDAPTAPSAAPGEAPSEEDAAANPGTCVSGGFFTQNLAFGNGTARVVGLCGS